MNILSPDILIQAYCSGIFPMAGDDGAIGWYEADPRAIIPLDQFHVPRRLARTVRNGGFSITFDTCFAAVMAACAEPAPGRETTWISPALIESYTALHQRGFAHSVEVHRDGQLVGGLYGVAIRGFFAGESMFSRERDASKVALVRLIEHLRAREFALLDTQFLSGDHLRRFGAVEISRAEYHRRLTLALRVQTQF